MKKEYVETVVINETEVNLPMIETTGVIIDVDSLSDIGGIINLNEIVEMFGKMQEEIDSLEATEESLTNIKSKRTMLKKANDAVKRVRLDVPKVVVESLTKDCKNLELMIDGMYKTLGDKIEPIENTIAGRRITKAATYLIEGGISKEIVKVYLSSCKEASQWKTAAAFTGKGELTKSSIKELDRIINNYPAAIETSIVDIPEEIRDGFIKEFIICNFDYVTAKNNVMVKYNEAQEQIRAIKEEEERIANATIDSVSNINKNNEVQDSVTINSGEVDIEQTPVVTLAQSTATTLTNLLMLRQGYSAEHKDDVYKVVLNLVTRLDQEYK